MSFLASGASFFGREFVPRHIKSDEGLFESLPDKPVINIFSVGLISGVTMAIIQIIVEINDKVNCTPLLTTRG